ncbi:hypothetical protein [Chryseobacterium sp. SC28]|nr:hypothetical protein [Chryseobacterium sp. SC28]
MMEVGSCIWAMGMCYTHKRGYFEKAFVLALPSLKQILIFAET